MLDAAYADILRQEGFELVGRLDYRLSLTAWWNPAPDKLLQVIVLGVGRGALIKADKSYYLKSVGTDGETWARDIGPLHDYLEGHFPELRISFSHFRDVPPELARSEVRRRLSAAAPTRPIPTVEQVARLQSRLRYRQRDVRAAEGMMGLLSGEPDLLTGYLRQQTRTQRAEADRPLRCRHHAAPAGGGVVGLNSSPTFATTWRMRSSRMATLDAVQSVDDLADVVLGRESVEPLAHVVERVLDHRRQFVGRDLRHVSLVGLRAWLVLLGHEWIGISCF